MNKAALFFFDNGIPVFPLVDGEKVPACRWLVYSCSRDTAARFRNYGVRLGRGLGVIDTDSEASESFVAGEIAAGRIPATPFMVSTARGRHRFYKICVPTPKLIHRAGLVIEFRNDGNYVVGPLSKHPSGCVYTPCEWSWSLDDVPIFPRDFVFDDRAGREASGRSDDPFELPKSITSPGRHDVLNSLIMSLVSSGNSDQFSTLPALRAYVYERVGTANANNCEPPLAEDANFKTWFDRSFRGAIKLRDLQRQCGPRVPLGLDTTEKAGWL